MLFGELRLGLSRVAPLAAGICLAAFALASSSGGAQAHLRHHRHARVAVHLGGASSAGVSTPAEVDGSKYSAIVIDANSGREIYGVNENALRHPASITKVMTLYLLFEKLEKGEMTLATRIPVSEHAAAQEPSKLGVPAGETISVEEAIKAIVTRSANDMAVAVAEAVGHDETSFAALMTHKAHQIGMSRTLYRNASGLPNDEQWTTARDLTVLARSMQERFPKYFHYFSLHEFTYNGEVIGNHDHLLGRVDGVDGIKTGYTRASGFNLLTSVHRDGRALVAVVMGGRSAPARDRLMERLIETHIAEAGSDHTATRIAEADSDEGFAAPPGRDGPRLTPVAEHEDPEAAPDRVAEAAPEPQGEGDDSADETPPAPAPRKFEHPKPMSPALAKAAALDPGKLGWKVGPRGKKPNPAPHKAAAEETRVARAEDGAAVKKGGWTIQVGATDDPDDARELLARAKSRHRALASVRGFTEKVRKDGDTVYRVRFAGLDSATAAKACHDLKQGGLSCFTTRD